MSRWKTKLNLQRRRYPKVNKNPKLNYLLTTNIITLTMTNPVQEKTLYNESHYFKGFQRDTNKLADEINKTYRHLRGENPGVEDYARHCNMAFNNFIKKLRQFYPEPFLKTIYQDHFPIEEVQRAFQDKMEYLSHSRDNLELGENEFEKAVINLNKSFLKVLMGKEA